MSRAIVETQNLFRKFDVNNDGVISRDEFEQGYKLFFQEDDEKKLRRMLDEFIVATTATNNSNSSSSNSSSNSNNNNTGSGDDRDVDYITWSMTLSPRDLPQITARCRDIGPLSLASPTEEEVELMESLYARGHVLAQEAATCGTRLLIDAEQVRYQPAIDNLVLELQRKHNSVDGDGGNAADFPIIYNTYQCYLKDAPQRLATDVERSERFQYHFGAKLVRGAYLESERALATLRGYPSPIHESLQ
jgi:proline dehydrogenase